jgi:PAS domain S-box-containing protein
MTVVVDVNFDINDVLGGEAWDAEQARVIFDSIGLGVLTVDHRLVISFANKKACEVFNQDKSLPLVGSVLFNLPRIQFSSLFHIKFNKASSSGHPVRFDEVSPSRKQWRYHLFPYVRGMTIVVEDITKDWHENEAQQMATISFNSLSEAVLLVRKSGHVFYANEAARRATGYSWVELIHASIVEVVPALDPATLDTIGISLKHHISFESELLRKDGRVVPAEVSVTHKRLYNSSYYIVTVWDITERKKAEEELKMAKAQAELYLDLMGHDINNMNQIALGYLELVEGMVTDDQIKELVKKPLAAIQNSSKLIENVRKLQNSKNGGLKIEAIDLNGLLFELRNQYLNVPDKDVTIDYTPRRDCYVMANQLLTDVFSNLIGNAIKHSGTSKVWIGVELERVIEDGREYCKVVVEDDGQGISDMQKNRAFDRIGEEKGRARGKGLGLYLVKSLVEDFHGIVKVEDRVQGDHRKGARFVVMLPAIEK